MLFELEGPRLNVACMYISQHLSTCTGFIGELHLPVIILVFIKRIMQDMSYFVFIFTLTPMFYLFDNSCHAVCLVIHEEGDLPLLLNNINVSVNFKHHLYFFIWIDSEATESGMNITRFSLLF